MSFRFSAPLWKVETGGWYFLTVPADQSEAIRSVPRPPAPGFGSIRVRATVGDYSWSTSIFPDSTVGGYLLPVKKAVRAAESVDVDDVVEVLLELAE